MTYAQTSAIDYSTSAMRRWEKLPEHVRAEVIDGRLYILSPPKRIHADIIDEIYFALVNHVRKNNLGKSYCSAVGNFLFDGTQVVMPDIVFVSNKNSHLLEERGIFGAPDLIIEVLSPSTKKHDIHLKKIKYEQAGVREYWIVDPDTKDTWGYLLENNSYNEPLTLNSKLHIRTLNKKIKF